ncbi:hypothetical protein [Arthrobacter sp. KNU40]|uniref:hypothetical protein n=1 Tax=Arthrobacter sp. KNU40 TaxID=3447965 RepID=UPI003F648D32
MKSPSDSTRQEDDNEARGQGSDGPATNSAQSQRTAWRRSKEFAAFKRSTIIMGTMIAMLTAALIVYFTVFNKRLMDLYGTQYVRISGGGGYEQSTGLDLLLVAISFAIGMIIVSLLAAIYYQYGEQQRRYENSMIITEITKDDVIDGAMDLKTLWMGNRRHLKNYHQIVMNYADSTKKSTGLYIMIGFIFILVTAAFALFAQSTSAAISSAIVATAASVLTGFIARAVLNNSAASSKELQTFFNHPIEVERALAAERLVGTFETPERRDDAKLLIVQSLTRQHRTEGTVFSPQTQADDQAPSQQGSPEETS